MMCRVVTRWVLATALAAISLAGCAGHRVLIYGRNFVSPDGRYLAVRTKVPSTGNWQIVIVDLQSHRQVHALPASPAAPSGPVALGWVGRRLVLT